MREACERLWDEEPREVLVIWPPSWRVRVVEWVTGRRMLRVKRERRVREGGCIVRLWWVKWDSGRC